jgi:uncharacterized membrane protein YbhN (UPF0104 family)
VLLGLLLSTTVFVELPSSSLRVRGVDIVDAATHSVAAVLTLVLAAVVGTLLGGEAVARLLRRIPKLEPATANFILAMRSGLRSLGRSPGRLVGVLSASVLVWLFTVGVAWAMLAAYPLMPSSLRVALTVSTAVIAGTLVIPTPGFFGPFEFSAKTVLVLWSVDPGHAASFALAWHLLVFVFTLAAGFAAAVLSGVSVRAAVEQPRCASSSTPG